MDVPKYTQTRGTCIGCLSLEHTMTDKTEGFYCHRYGKPVDDKNAQPDWCFVRPTPTVGNSTDKDSKPIAIKQLGCLEEGEKVVEEFTLDDTRYRVAVYYLPNFNMCEVELQEWQDPYLIFPNCWKMRRTEFVQMSFFDFVSRIRLRKAIEKVKHFAVSIQNKRARVNKIIDTLHGSTNDETEGVETNGS